MDKKEESDVRNVHHKNYEGHSLAKFWAKKRSTVIRAMIEKLDK
ncbi:MAG: hypothetical protein WBB47_00740 [Paenisporosarcina sp.]